MQLLHHHPKCVKGENTPEKDSETTNKDEHGETE